MQNSNQYKHIIYGVQDIIEKKVGQPLTLDYLAKEANLSPFYFHRLFHYVTKESLYQCIKRNRLEKAAFLLQNNRNQSVTEIAFEVGFANQSSFAKAFKLHYGISASEYRNGKSQLFINQKIIKRDDVIQPLYIKVENCEQTNLYYVRHIGAYKGNQQLFKKLIGQLLKQCEQNDLKANKKLLYCIYHDSGEHTIDELLRLSIGIEAVKEAKVIQTLGNIELDAGKYAIGRFVLNNDNFQQAWDYMLFEWLGNSEYVFDYRLPYERYSGDIATEKGKNVVDICIPIK